MRKTLTDKGVTALKPRSGRYAHPDPEMRGHYIRVTPTGAKSFWVVPRDPFGKQVWTKVGNADVLTIDEAREKAREAIKRTKAGLPAIEPPPVKPDTFKAVAEDWLKRHVIKKKLRSEREIKRCLEKYVYPHWADRDFISIKRSDITKLLDDVEDHHGSRQADMVKAWVCAITHWFAGRSDDYISPFVRGMKKRHEKNKGRERILDDTELKTVWKAAEANGQFGALIRLLLLTGQRREKVATMKWADVADGVWTIETAEREKGNAGALALPVQALAIIEAQPRVGNNPYIFSGRGLGCRNFSQSKGPFDAKLPKMPGWTLHDLRRTARSLMSRADVRPDIAEKVLGHAVAGVEGVYDRHGYDSEKAAALAKLATLVDSIVSPRDNVLPMTKEKKKRLR